MKKRIYQFIFFRLMGWKIVGSIDENIKKCVLMVVPHTSWHDFFLGVLIRGIIQLEMNWVGKKELFQFHQVFLIKLSNMYLLSKDNYSLKHMKI